MREKNFNPIFNVTNDAELEALAKAYIQTAHKRNLSISAACDLISQFWNENSSASNSTTITQQTHEDEKIEIFRQKTQRFISHFPDFVPYYDSPVSQKDVLLNTDFTVEIICGIYKMFIEKRDIRSSDLIIYLYELLSKKSNNPDYYNRSRIKSFKDYIFDKVSYIYLKMSYPVGNGSRFIYRVDTSYMPILAFKIKESTLDKDFRRIKSAAEPYEEMQKYDIKPTPTFIKVVQLIWVIETFF